MAPVESRITRFLELADRDSLTRSELITGTLFELVRCEPPRSAKEIVELLPEDLMADLRHLLGDIRRQDYQWTPFIIGHSLQPGTLACRLRQLDQTIQDIGSTLDT